jgi:hypothetical protein
MDVRFSGSATRRGDIDHGVGDVRTGVIVLAPAVGRKLGGGQHGIG